MLYRGTHAHPRVEEAEVVREALEDLDGEVGLVEQDLVVRRARRALERVRRDEIEVVARRLGDVAVDDRPRLALAAILRHEPRFGAHLCGVRIPQAHRRAARNGGQRRGMAGPWCGEERRAAAKN
eukprot:5061344-Prymnesium_polylepis.1